MKITTTQKQIESSQHSLWLSRLLAGLVLVLGILVLLGWAFEITFLMYPFSGLAAMNPITAVSFILLGFSLLMLAGAKKASLKQVAGSALAYIVLGIGILKLSEIILGADIHIDTWLCYSKMKTGVNGNLYNLMAPNTALNIVITSIALLLLNKQTSKKQIPSQFLSLFVGFIAMISILGYLYHVKAFYVALKYFPMAIHTAIGFLLLTFAILFVHPDKGLMSELSGSKAGAMIARKLIPAVLITPILLGFVRLYAEQKGLISNELGVGLLVLGIIIIFLFLIWLSARELNKKDELRKEAEKNLRKSLKDISDYKYTLDESSILTITDQKGMIQQVNDNFCIISKYKREELIGQDHNLVNSGYHTKEFMRDLWATIGKGKIWKGEIKNKAKDGTYYWVDTTIVPFINEQGKPYQYVAIRSDVTHRKDLEDEIKQLNLDLEQKVKDRTEELTDKQNQLRSVFNSVADSIFVLDKEKEGYYRFNSVNPAFLKTFNINYNEVVGKRFNNVIPKTLLAQTLEKFEEAIRTKEMVRWEEFTDFPSGKITGEVNIAPIFDEAGNCIRLVGSVHDLTKRKKAEKALLESENYLRTIVETEPECVKLLDINGELQSMNPAGLAMIEADSLAQVQGKSLLSIIDSSYREAFKELSQNIFKDIPGKMEFEITGLKGTHRWLETQAVPLKNAEGKIISLLGVTRDITESKKAEDDIKELTNRLQLATNAAKLGIWDWYLTKNNLIWDENMYQIFGVKPDKFNGAFEAWSNTVHPDDLQNSLAEVQKAIDGIKDFHASFRIIWPNKEVRYIEGHAIILRDEVGKAIRMIGINRDITEQKKAEVRISKSESKFRHLMNAIPDGLIGTNIHGKIIYANDVASILFGYTKDELLNNKIEMLLPPRFRASHESHRESYLANPENREMGKADMFMYGRRKDGSEFATEVSLSSIETEEGLVILSTIRDITEKKIAEQAIIQSEARLKKAQEIAHLGHWELDFTTGYTFMSDEACRIHGIPILQHEQSPEAWLSFIHPEDLDFVLKNMKEAQDTLSDFALNYRIKRKDGTIRYIYSETKFQFDSTDKPTGMYGIAHDITERITAEENLKQSEAHLAEAQRLAKMGSWNLDLKADRLTWSEELYNVFGTDKQTLRETQASYLQLIDAEDREFTLQSIIHTQQTGDPFTIEYHITTPKGEKRIIQEYGYGVKDEHGIVTRLFGTAQNITERKKAEEALKLFRMLIDRSNDAIEIMDLKTGRFLDVNEKGCQDLGYSREEFLALSVFDIDPIVTPLKFKGIGDELRKSGSLLWEGYHRRKNGSTFPVEVNIKYVKLDRDYMIAVVRDITERKQAEEKLKESERFLTESQAVSKIGSYVLDFNTGEWKSSHELNNIFGFTTNGKHTVDEWVSLVHPDHQKMMQEYFTREVIGKKQQFNKEYKIINKNTGKECWVHGIGDLDFDSTGAPVKMLGTIQNITERKKSELLLKHLNDNLEKKAAELEISNTELEHFAYVASHDLQEPLRMVSSFLNLLEKRMDGQLDETNRQYIDFAVDGTRRMKSLIIALLEYSRVGANKEDFAPVDLNEVVQYVTNVLDENIKKNTALITFKFLPVITANKTLITHLFLNLVNNALKYHGDKQPEIKVGYTEEPDNWIFYVKDNGIGIQPKFFDKIFIIFKRLHNKDEYSGTGIGLAICKKIAETHKGKIWVESEPGNGSTFYFSIPKNKI